VDVWAGGGAVRGLVGWAGFLGVGGGAVLGGVWEGGGGIWCVAERVGWGRYLARGWTERRTGSCRLLHHPCNRIGGHAKAGA